VFCGVDAGIVATANVTLLQLITAVTATFLGSCLCFGATLCCIFLCRKFCRGKELKSGGGCVASGNQKGPVYEEVAAAAALAQVKTIKNSCYAIAITT